MAAMMDTGLHWLMRQAWTRSRRPKRCKLANNPRLRQAVARKLQIKLVARADRRLAEESPSWR